MGVSPALQELEPHLLLRSTRNDVVVFELGGGRAAVYSSSGHGDEGPNEDAVLVLPTQEGSAVLAVADGVGGGAAGHVASELAVRSVAEAVRAAVQEDQGVRFGILNGFELANERILAEGRGAATTLAVAELNDGAVRTYHVGDSFALVTGQRGRVKLQTIAHSPVGYGVEAGLLDEAEAMHHEERHVISNAVGSSDMRIELGLPLQLAPRDTLLIGTDGLSDNLHTEEIIRTMRKGALDGAAESLARQALCRMNGDAGDPSKPDDLSFVVFRPRPA
jgi:serine/threonine protein phosphatase PrpC